ncbi:MAG: hypothetical protein ACREDZ_14145 [Kiloniellales bacterium]
MTRYKLLSGLAAAAVLFAGVAAQAAADHEAAIKSKLLPQIKTWMQSDAVISALNSQNQKNVGLSQGDIDALDAKWREETKGGATPMIDSALASALSGYLRDLKAKSGGVITEIFVMDSRGLNVGQSDASSDYWQGDEDKWQKTYPMGPNAVFIDEVEMDESTQTFQSQVSLSVVDPASGTVIGAITVGVNIDALQ